MRNSSIHPPRLPLLFAVLCLLALAGPLFADDAAAAPLFDRIWDLNAVQHPVLVHFPIALILMSAGIVVLRVKWKGLSEDAAAYCLYIGAAGAVLACVTGWAFAEYKAYGDDLFVVFTMPEEQIKQSEETMFYHRWFGILTTVAAVILSVLCARARRGKAVGTTWKAGVVVTAFFVGLVGHWGGEMVYGKGIIFKQLWAVMGWEWTEHRPKAAKPPPGVKPPANGGTAPPPPDKVDFVMHIKPIFEGKCIACHGPKKQKAEFRMDTKEHAFNSGDSAPDNIVPKELEFSYLYETLLSKDKKEMMPPPKEGGPLPKEEIELIRRWIEQGAEWPDDVTLEDPN